MGISTAAMSAALSVVKRVSEWVDLKVVRSAGERAAMLVAVWVAQKDVSTAALSVAWMAAKAVEWLVWKEAG